MKDWLFISNLYITVNNLNVQNSLVRYLSNVEYVSIVRYVTKTLTGIWNFGIFVLK